MWPGADKADSPRHLDDLTEDQCLSPPIGIRYSWANEALNLLISLDPPVITQAYFASYPVDAQQLTPRVHVFYSLSDTHGSFGWSLW